MTNLRRVKRIVQVFLCVFFSLFFCVLASAQYRLDNWTTENGLPQNTVTGVVQADDGYIWGTTFGGIFRFDGVRFKVFNKSNTKGLDESRYIKVFKDGFGRIWFLSEAFSVVKYEDGKFTTFHSNDEFEGKIRGAYLHRDSDGNIVFSTGKGHFRFEDSRFVKFHIPNSKTDEFICLADRKGGLWLCSKSGVRRIFEGTEESFDINFSDDENVHPHLYDDRFGNIWIFEQNGYRIHRKKVQKLAINTNGVFLEDMNRDFWISIENELVKIDGNELDSERIDFSKLERLPIVNESSPGSVIVGITQDTEGGFWIGTGNKGLFHLTPQTFRMKTKSDWGTKDELVYPILEDRSGNIWVGIWLNSLVKYSKNNSYQVYQDALKSQFLTTLFENSEKRLYLGNLNRFYVFENGNFRDTSLHLKVPFTQGIFSISEDDLGNLWLATNIGLVKYNEKSAELFTTKDGLPSDYVTTTLKTEDGKLWLGTKLGLAVLEEGKITAFTEQDDLKNDHIRSLYKDESGVLWIGTYDTGLIRYKDGKFKRITKKDGLQNENVFCTLEDDNGWFWINTNNGIYRVRKKQLNDFADGKIGSVESIGYNKKDGLLSMEGNGGKQPAGIKRSNGELWFPTQKGIAIVNPSEISKHLSPPPVYLEEISIDENEIGKYGEEIELQPEQGNLAINYTGLSYLNSPLVKFRYRLEGLEEDWIEVGTRRTAFYNNLPPGEYIFHVLAANRDGIWNNEGAMLKIVKLPHYYQTWWFLILSILTAVGIIGYIFYTRLSKFREIAEAKTRFSKRLIESQEAERKRIASELHDGLGQELIIIKNRVYLAQQYSDDKESLKKELDEIAETTSQTLEDVREITNELRPVLLDRAGLSKAIKFMLEKVSTFLNVESDIDPIDELLTEDSEINIYRIIQESTGNVIKHSNASLVLVKVKQIDDEVIISIEDNGKGFDVTNVQPSVGGGLGLVGLKERTQALNGEISIISKKGEGTKVLVKVPVNKSQ